MKYPNPRDVRKSAEANLADFHRWFWHNCNSVPRVNSSFASARPPTSNHLAALVLRVMMTPWDCCLTHRRILEEHPSFKLAPFRVANLRVRKRSVWEKYGQSSVRGTLKRIAKSCVRSLRSLSRMLSRGLRPRVNHSLFVKLYFAGEEV
jgi:hypothetical protein